LFNSKLNGQKLGFNTPLRAIFSGRIVQLVLTYSLLDVPHKRQSEDQVGKFACCILGQSPLKENSRFTLERYSSSNKNFWWFRLFSNSPWLMLWNLKKMSKMKLVSSFQLTTLFAKQRCTFGFFVSVARW